MEESSTGQTLGEYLRAARTAAGLTSRELARLAGINQSYLVKLENDQNDNPSAEKLQRFAEALDIDPAELLTFIGVKPPSALPPVRAYFRRKLGVDADEAEVLARLIEDYQQKRKEEPTHDNTNQGGDGQAH